MTTRPAHLRHLLIATSVLCAMTITVAMTAGDAAAGSPDMALASAATAVLWLFTLAWTLMAAAFAIDALIVAAREHRRQVERAQQPRRHRRHVEPPTDTNVGNGGHWEGL